MKKVLRNIIPVVCLLSAVSCSLDEHSYMYIQADNYMNDASEAEKVLLNVYRDMVKDEVYGYQLSLMFTLPTDIARIEGNSTEGTSRLICSNAYSSSQVEVKNTYMALYKGVYDANWFLSEIEEKMQGYTREDRELATYYIAEARCLRALYYFELLRWFGHIALVTTPEDSYLPADSFTQAEPEDVYKFIEADLLAAIDVLPYAMDDSVRSSNDFRFSKGGAMGLLAKVYATWAGYPVHDTSKWADCADIAGKLIASGKHGLLDEADGGYEQLWYNTCNGIWDPTESLIEVSFYSPTYSGSSDPCGRIGKWNGVRTSQISGERGSCAGNEKVVHTFVIDWRSEDEDRTDGSAPAMAGLSAVLGSGRVFWTMAIAYFLIYGTIMVFQGTTSIQYFRSDVYSFAMAAWFVTMIGVGKIVSTMLIGRLASRGVLRSKKKVMMTGTLLYAAVWGIIWLMAGKADDPWFWMSVCTMFGFFGGFMTLSFSQVKEWFPISIAGTAMSMMNVSLFLGSAVLTAVAGIVLHSVYTLENYSTLWCLMFASSVLAFLLVCLSKERKDGDRMIVPEE